MCNWVDSTISLQGKKESIHNFIKIGLKNSNLETTEDIEKDFQTLLTKATTKKVKTLNSSLEENNVNTIVNEIYLSMRTFRPMPDTFLMYDTTNFAEQFKVEAKKQKELYGVVGWYDYNIKTLGTKWNADFENCSLRPFNEDPNYYRLDFNIKTAWAFPDRWIDYILVKCPNIKVKCQSIEESNQFYCFGEYDEIMYDIAPVYDFIYENEIYDQEKTTDEVDPDIVAALELIKSFNDDFSDFCELDGTIEPYIKKMEKIYPSLIHKNIENS